MRLGCPARLYGMPPEPTLPAEPEPRLDVLGTQLAYLRDALVYLGSERIAMFRPAAALIDALAEAWPQGNVEGYRAEFDALGTLARASGMRLCFHPHSAVALSTTSGDQAWLSAGWLTLAAAFLDALALPAESVVVVHVGGSYGDPAAASERFLRRYESLPEAVRARLALENDDRLFGHADVARIHDACGIPLVLDVLHHCVWNPQGVALQEALARSLASWPAGVTPKIHFATPRSEARGLGSMSRLKVPTWTEHGDFCSPFEFAAFCRLGEGLPPFDVMIESRAHDLAVLKLRADLARYTPALANRVC